MSRIETRSIGPSVSQTTSAHGASDGAGEVNRAVVRQSAPSITSTVADVYQGTVSKSARPAGAGPTYQITRNELGTPTIRGTDALKTIEGLGYAIAQDRLWSLELVRRASRGTLAEFFGEKALASDVLVRTLSYTQPELERMVGELDAQQRKTLEAYRDGINTYLREVDADPEKKPYEIGLMEAQGLRMRPWTVEDSLAAAFFSQRTFGTYVGGGNELMNLALLQHLQRAYGPEEARGIFDDVRWVEDPQAPVTIPGKPKTDSGATESGTPRRSDYVDAAAVAQTVAQQGERAHALLRELGVPAWSGSFAWAVSGNRSASGKALLVSGPQVDLTAPDQTYPARLLGGGLDLFMITIPGSPRMSIGHSKDLAIALTAGYGDVVDTYVERLHPQDPTRYLFKGEYLPLQTRNEVINVRGRGPETVRVARTVHGPVIGTDAANGVAYTLRLNGWGQEHKGKLSFLEHASVAELDKHIQKSAKESVYSYNVVAADRRGHIGYWRVGSRPARPAGYDPRLPLPGDGSAEWQEGVYTPIPGASDPAQGYFANWNNKPAQGLSAGDSISYFTRGAYNWGKTDRVAVIDRRLRSAGPFSVADMEDIVKDIARSERLGTPGRELVPYILTALKAETDPALVRLGKLLEAWDGNLYSDAVTSTTIEPAATLFAEWVTLIQKELFSAELGPHFERFVSYNALERVLAGRISKHDYWKGKDRQQVIRACLAQAAQKLTGELGADPAQWRRPRPETEIKHALGMKMATLPSANRSAFTQIVEVGNRAEFNVPLGNNGFIDRQGKPHPSFGAFLERYKNFRYRKVDWPAEARQAKRKS